MVPRMKKRTAAAALWFYTSWYATQMGAFALGVSEAGDVVGPVVGAAVALLIAVDPRRLIWSARRAQAGDAPIPVPTGA